MEFPHLGRNCCEQSCQKLDFLPMRCDACDNIFCQDHFNYRAHKCPSSYKKDVQVPVCPLCSEPIPVPRGQPPDLAVGAHIDRDCQADPAKKHRKVFTNKCSMRGCKAKELIPVVCPECRQNFCLKHRHTADHRCSGQLVSMKKKVAESAIARAENSKNIRHINTNISKEHSMLSNTNEDEALARAIALSLQDGNAAGSASTPMTQEQSDAMLARAIAESQMMSEQPLIVNQPTKERCLLS